MPLSLQDHQEVRMVKNSYNALHQDVMEWDTLQEIMLPIEVYQVVPEPTNPKPGLKMEKQNP